MQHLKLRFAIIAALAASALGGWPCAAETTKRLLEERSFNLMKRGNEQVIFTLGEAGTVVAKARIRQPLPTTSVRLVLQGPDGLQVEKEGSAPVRLRYPVDETRAGAIWRLSVINVNNMPIAGKLTIELLTGGEPEKHRDATGDASKPRSSTRAIDGKVRTLDNQLIRAVCRDKNPDVFVRLDMKQGSGALYLSFNEVFTFEASYAAERVIEIRGNGEHPLYLDMEKRVLYFTSGEEKTFCGVRIYLGEGG